MNGAQGLRFPQVPCASDLLIGIAKALVGYFGAWASVQFDLEQFLGRLALTVALVLFHSLALTGLRHVLVASPPFQPLDLASLVLLNSALALAGCVARTVSRALPSDDHGRTSDL